MTDVSTQKLKELIPQCLFDIAAEIKTNGGELFLVGGWVRDFLRNQPSVDFDLEVYRIDSKSLDAILSKYGKPNHVGKAFGITHVRIDKKGYDFAFPRTEKKVSDGHKGFDVKPDPNLDFPTAASRRDFTVNAMGIRLPDGKFVDAYYGREDLHHGVLRHVSTAFSEDPLRVLRAVQFAARFEYKIDTQTAKLCHSLDLSELSRERIFGELSKLLLKSAKPSIGLEWMRKMDLLRWFPEIEQLIGVPQDGEWHPEGDVWRHTLLVVDEAASLRHHFQKDSEKLAYMLGALCHDLGKSFTTSLQDGRWRSPAHDALGEKPVRSLLGKLTDDKELTEKVVAYVKEHLRPALLHKARHEIKPGAIRRLSLRISIPDLVLLAQADHFGRTTADALSRQFEAGEWLLERSQELNVLSSAPKPWLTGKFLISAGMKPGKAMGELIKESFEIQLEGGFENLEAVQGWALTRIPPNSRNST